MLIWEIVKKFEFWQILQKTKLAIAMLKEIRSDKAIADLTEVYHFLLTEYLYPLTIMPKIDK